MNDTLHMKFDIEGILTAMTFVNTSKHNHNDHVNDNDNNDDNNNNANDHNNMQ